MTTYTTPAGSIYKLYADMLNQHHTLIAGETGAGKSVLINGLIATALYKAPTEVQFILIDPKRVSLKKFATLPHVIKYANDTDMINALQYAVNLMMVRYDAMERAGIEEYTGSKVYVIIDELLDLMTTAAKAVTPLIQRLCQLGRAAGISVIAATQCPLAAVLPTPIKVNFTAKVGLHVAEAQHSRNIIGIAGCESLPQHGKCYYVKPMYKGVVNVPKVDNEEILRLIAHWNGQKAASTARKADPKPAARAPRKGLFGKLFA